MPPKIKTIIKKEPKVCPHRMNVLYVDINIARFSKVVELDKSTWTLGKFIPSAVPKKITGIRSKNKFGMKGTKSKELPYKMKAILIKLLNLANLPRYD